MFRIVCQVISSWSSSMYSWSKQPWSYIYSMTYQSGWTNESNDRFRFWETGESEALGFEYDACSFEMSSSQTNATKIDTCHFLAWCSALLGY